MFFANAAYENQFLTALGAAEGERHYRAMELSGRLTWYVVTCAVVSVDGLEFMHTVCCALEEDLLDLLREMPNSRPVSLLRIASSADCDGRWEAREVAKVWKAVDHRNQQVLVLQDVDGFESSGAYGDAVDEEIVKRRLVFEAPHTNRDSDNGSPADRTSSDLPVYCGPLDLRALVSAKDLAAHLGCRDGAQVRRMVKSGKVLALKGRGSPARYPLYQAAFRERFGDLLDALRGCDATDAHAFFTSESADLGWLRPVEAFVGAALNRRQFHAEALELVAMDEERRFQAVLSAAQAFVADSSGRRG